MLDRLTARLTVAQLVGYLIGAAVMGGIAIALRAYVYPLLDIPPRRYGLSDVPDYFLAFVLLAGAFKAVGLLDRHFRLSIAAAAVLCFPLTIGVLWLLR